MNYGAYWPTAAKRWDAMVISPSREAEFARYAQDAVTNRARYEEIENGSGVPWPLIACLHRRESGANFTKYLGNGQALSERTTIAPVGRGPFTGPQAFFNGALDALAVDGLDKVLDWRLEKELYYMEKFNGFGYANRGLPSAYIWAGTNIQGPGKFGGYPNGPGTAFVDNWFDASAIDSQPGCAPLLKLIHQQAGIPLLQRETADVGPVPVPVPTPVPTPGPTPMPLPVIPPAQAIAMIEAGVQALPAIIAGIKDLISTIETIKADLDKLKPLQDDMAKIKAGFSGLFQPPKT